MMETKFTKGQFSLSDGYGSVLDERGYAIADVNDIAILDDYTRKLNIQHWGHSPDASRDLSEDEVEGNAHLFAAAPALYAALEELVDGQCAPHSHAIHSSGYFCHKCGRNDKNQLHDDGCPILKAEAALSAARGEVQE